MYASTNYGHCNNPAISEAGTVKEWFEFATTAKDDNAGLDNGCLEMGDPNALPSTIVQHVTRRLYS